MYLFAFTFLLVSLLGVYTQIYMIQTVKFFSDQKVVAQDLIGWHVAAMTLSRTMSITGGYPCSLSSVGGCGAKSVASSGDLPTGDTAKYTWRSLLYKPSAALPSKYVVTYIQPTDVNTTTHIITTPDVGLTREELAQQLKNAKLARSLYGLVASTGTGCVLSSMSGKYVPVDCSVPLTSLAIVSQVE